MTTGDGRGRRRGITVIEMALALPMLLLVLFGIIQFGSVFFVHHNMVQAAREAARSLAVQDGTAAAASQVANDRLAVIGGIDFTISITQPAGNDPNDNDVTVRITAPVSEAALGDPLGIMGGGTISAQVTMRKEG